MLFDNSFMKQGEDFFAFFSFTNVYVALSLLSSSIVVHFLAKSVKLLEQYSILEASFSNVSVL